MQSKLSLNTTALETARILESSVAMCAYESGLMAFLNTPRTVEEIIRRLRFSSTKADALLVYLRLLVHEGCVVETLMDSRLTVFQCALPSLDREAINLRAAPHSDLLQDWMPISHADRIRDWNRSFLGLDLQFFRREDGFLTFDKEWDEVWNSNLTNPLYEFGRLMAVEEAAKRGDRVLDLACGPGFGLRSLAEASIRPMMLYGVDVNRHYLERARGEMLLHGSRVQLAEWDLNHGLEPEAKARTFDAALFMGAFHYIREKLTLLREIFKVLRPGGLLVLGYCYADEGCSDEKMQEFYFAITNVAYWRVSGAQLRDLVVQAGFEIGDQFRRGSQYTIYCEKPADFASPE